MEWELLPSCRSYLPYLQDGMLAEEASCRQEDFVWGSCLKEMKGQAEAHQPDMPT